MHLTRFTDLSLRVLMYLTYKDRTTYVTVSKLAESFCWSRNHIVKVAHFMSVKGWICSHRGRSGGLSLARDPSTYRIGDLVRELEGDQPLIECRVPHCTMYAGCEVRAVVEEAKEAFYEKLNKYTLASITESPAASAMIAKLNREEISAAKRASRSSSLIIKPRRRRSAMAQ